MASTALGDIPGARFHESIQAAALASSAATGIVGGFGPFDHPVRVRDLYFVPSTAAGLACTQTASYRQYTLFNAGTSGSGTVVIASANMSFATNATIASFKPVTGSVSTVSTIFSAASKTYFVLSQTTVGGNDSNGTLIPAGTWTLSFEVV